MTGRGAAREHEQPGTDAPVPGVRRAAGAAPDSRLPADPVPDSRPPAGPAPDSRLPADPAPDGRPSAGPVAADRGATDRERTGPVAPQPRATPPRPPDHHRPVDTDRTDTPEHPDEEHPTGAYRIEPTTGAPVDEVPSRVPVRQPGGPPRPGVPADDGPDADEDDFWLPIEEVHWDGTPIRTELAAPDAPSTRWAWPRRRPRTRATRQRDPRSGLPALLGLSLLVAFFAWVSAEPFWLAVGHGTAGTVVVDCTGSGLTQRCRGTFTAGDGGFLAHGVRVSGVTAEQRQARTALAARMTGPDGAAAYVDTGGGRHLRWLLGFALMLACASGITRVTGTAGLADPRSRRWATLAAWTAPLLVALGFLAAAF
ncbi:hypothetical protein PVK37_10140 [Micromonospora cathayae]|uniref:Uncharacterized protein n=1 Tax=Micromonospora cathayae TaxID=3028804 RepID=A0ABY7ZUJ6_9ACTN|nr:hypothetical protein [Micromonospora sp. HUAS 3]WDZ86721.1 hypothetical protein PVK37_10140 [Micromonospora sp. HUAS 3]